DERPALRLASGHIPQPHRRILTGGGQRLAIRAEGYAPNRASVAGEWLTSRLAGGHIPQPHRLIPTAGGQRLAVGAEDHAFNPASVAGEAGNEMVRSAKPSYKSTANIFLGCNRHPAQRLK